MCKFLCECIFSFLGVELLDYLVMFNFLSLFEINAGIACLWTVSTGAGTRGSE
jgi:hypothetical protein